MATKLTNLVIEEVSCVDAGANPHAAIMLAKRADSKDEKTELGTEVAAKSGKVNAVAKETEPTVEQLQAELKKAHEISATVEELRKRADATDEQLKLAKAEAATEKSEREALQKRNDELAKQAKEEKDARRLVEFAKMADTKLPNLKGTSSEKGAILKSLEDNLPPDDVPKVMELLEAGNEAMGKQFVPVGNSGAGDGLKSLLEGH